MGLFSKDPAATIPPDYLAVLRSGFGTKPADKAATKLLGPAVEALRSELRAGETPELIIVAGGVLTVTDARLIWILRGQVRQTVDRASIHSVETTPGEKLGYELVFKARSGGTLGERLKPYTLAEARHFRLAVAPGAASKTILAPEDVVDRMTAREP